MTTVETQSIVAEVLKALRANAVTIDELTPQTSLADTDKIEISGGKSITYAQLAELITSDITEEVSTIGKNLTQLGTSTSESITSHQQTLSAHATAITNNHAAIEELKADPHRHVVISLVKLTNWTSKELADALSFLWDYTQQHTLYVNVGTVIVFHSPTEGWVSYQWRNRRGTDDEADLKNPANWERYTPKAEDLAKLEALPAKAEIDAAIEAASRQWLIDQAVAAGATYNTSTGKFSYGPTGYVISDIGDDEMLRMLQCRVVGDGIGGAFNDANIRINLCPMVEYKNNELLPWRQLCSKNNTIQVLRTSMHTNRQFTLASSKAISDCSALRYIEGCFVTNLPQHNFTGLPALEYIWVVIRNGACINLKDSPNLTLECLQKIPSAAIKSSATATVTVHPTVYAKLTDTTNTQWHKVLTDALAKNITFATTE